MEVYGVIYGIELLFDHRIYIGQSRDINKRIAQHKYSKKAFVDQEIHKYGWENFTWTVLEKCGNQEELDAAEKRWILRLNSIYPNGFNRTFGGKLHYQYANDVLKKISESSEGKEFSQEHKNNLSKAKIGKKLKKRTMEHCLNNSITKKKNFYPNLEVEIEKKTLTHAELARRLNLKIKFSTITSKLCGDAVMDLDTAIAIKEFLGVDMPLEELFKKTDDTE